MTLSKSQYIPVYLPVHLYLPLNRNLSMFKTWQLKILKLSLIRKYLSDKQYNIIVQKGILTFKTHFYVKVIVSKAF